MEDSINPYAEWLGIARRSGRPNHYALLGLAQFESDRSAIVTAAERQMAVLSRVEPGPHEPLKQQLLAELIRAKKTLTDAALKMQYDELLRQKATLRSGTSPQRVAPAGGNQPQLAQSRDRVSSGDLLPPRAIPAALPLPMAPTTGDPMAPVTPIENPALVIPGPSSSFVPAEQTPVADNRVGQVSDQLASARMAARKLAMRRQKAPYWVLASMLALLVVVAAALAVGYASGLIHIGLLPVVAKRDPDRQGLPPLEHEVDDVADKRDRVGELADEPRAVITKSPIPAADIVAPRAESQTAKTESESASSLATKPVDSPIDPAQTARFAAELAAARKALGERKAQAAKERVGAAEKLAASDEQKELVAGFQELPKYVDGFWEAVREGVKGLEEAGELKVGNTIVSIVEVTTQRLTLRTNGQNRRYPLEELPAGIAVAIAKKWFDDRPDNKVYLGAFYFVDPRTDVAEAKRLWEEAQSAGVDVKQLLKLLSIADK